LPAFSRRHFAGEPCERFMLPNSFDQAFTQPLANRGHESLGGFM
jgi:hypothetical protein